jgi:hypothetical protein
LETQAIPLGVATTSKENVPPFLAIACKGYKGYFSKRSARPNLVLNSQPTKELYF